MAEDEVNEPVIEIEEPALEEPEADEESEEEVEVPEETEEKEDEDLSGLPTKEFNEGDLVSFPNLATEDADGDPITYTFSEPLDEDGEWQTEVGDAGSYKVTINAEDSKGAESSIELALIILSTNKAPVIEIADEIKVKEGETILLEPEVSDPEGDDFTLSYSGWIDSAQKETGFEDSGDYEVTITAEDSNGAKSEKNVKIIIENVNRKPVIAGIEDLTIKEGDEVSIEPEISDDDGDDLTIEFSNPLDDEGSWTTEEGDAGSYDLTVTVSDGTDSVEKTIKLTVAPLNRAPTLTLAQEEITVEETETVVIDASAEDPDGDDVTITYSGWMTSSTKETTYSDEGTYEVTVTAADDKGAETVGVVTIVVEDKNRPPEIVI